MQTPASQIISDAIEQIAEHGQSLSRETARDVMVRLLAGSASEAQIAALLVALHMKGETVEEIVGFAEAIRAAAAPIKCTSNHSPLVSHSERDALIDTCGTGGDATGTFNISTATALTVAGAGVRVAKHGNRSATSQCGSADVVEALGVNLNLPAEKLSQCLEKVGIAFLFAQAIHSAMKYVQPARRQLRLRTIFNLLGPLTNPAQASCQIVGVYAESLVVKLAEVLRMLGVERAMVVHGRDGLDEITISAPTKVAELRDGKLIEYEVAPEDFGLKRAPLSDIRGGNVQENTAILREILDGKPSAKRDVVLLNAAAALLVAGKANSMRDAIPLAQKSIDSGAAREKLAALVEFTNQHRPE